MPKVMPSAQRVVRLETQAFLNQIPPRFRHACILIVHLNKTKSYDNSLDLVYSVSWEGGVDYRHAEALSGLLVENVILSPRHRPY